MHPSATIPTCCSAVLLSLSAACFAGEPTFTVHFDPALQKEAYSGRVYVVVGKKEDPAPRTRMDDWGGKVQVFAVQARGVGTGGTVVLDGSAAGWPKKMSDLAAGDWWAQAVADRSPDSPDFGNGPGDLYSDPVKFTLTEAGASPVAVKLKLTKEVEEKPFAQTEQIKLFEQESPLLTRFAGRSIKNRAAVRLPKGWTDDPKASWPVLYVIGGFGSDHGIVRWLPSLLGEEQLDKVLLVVPDPRCGMGHSVFADSATNGPRGAAFINELIPAVEAKYHGAGAAKRYITGLSSGGWTTLWAQVTYPEQFAQSWAHCPDPVDFRDFQRVDLYKEGSNIYTDEAGKRRPVARRGDTPWLWYDDFVHQEEVLGPGGQIHAFEAVFSPLGKDGTALLMFDRATGKVDVNVAKKWEPYDIRLVLERNWERLGPKLKGKVHVYAGGLDTFYLDGAVKLLKESMTKLGSDAEIEIIDGMAHTFYIPAVKKMMDTIAGPAGGK